ncbi:hypothetical protein CEUSTIGMA_g6342.t1 [Chlamydomonas eustigma]|uniref:50S ribosomal protein L22, chloroplastic n=1 Tax=Chlamydomonas eustigma TaxID=1157962 RepID=A0A250X740_9CHLO|nr:hypothetical protein CEUSTIGMA_g6342.t1 [Chlamydomonas eustigma]|eukprot:GAX78903.1 hypothetical protein CEUSTIGMA_g6342.t1 [Chlamydomonas eustigma]
MSLQYRSVFSLVRSIHTVKFFGYDGVTTSLDHKHDYGRSNRQSSERSFQVTRGFQASYSDYIQDGRTQANMHMQASTSYTPVFTSYFNNAPFLAMRHFSSTTYATLDKADTHQSEPREAQSQRSVQSPLQNLFETLSPPNSEKRSPVPTYDHVPRLWTWYRMDDEREEQAKERSALKERYADAGYAKRVNAKQSVKKLDRVIKMIRGLAYQEAVNQCRMWPLKAARILIECLDKALENARDKGLDESRLVVATLYATKGVHEQTGLIYMGKGFAAKKISRRSHITIVLREAYDSDSMQKAASHGSVFGPIGRGRRAPRGINFAARVVSPTMTMSGAGLKPRRRFAYWLEV